MKKPVPTHIAIIMDGNRRWARQHKLPLLEGHRRVANVVLEKLVEHSARRGIKYITFWAFSTENWDRAQREVKEIMQILSQGIGYFGKRMYEKGVKLRVIGDLTRLDPGLQKRIEQLADMTKENKRIALIIAMNYGGRDEIIRAINKWREISNHKSQTPNINDKEFNKYLDTKDIPDPDFIIRTGGEQRLSGFLPWQSVYSELYFPAWYMPDFTPERLDEAIEEFARRQRRFGK